MSEPVNPFESPASLNPQASQEPPRSKAPKVFGILHIIFACLGILAVAGNLASKTVQKQIDNLPADLPSHIFDTYETLKTYNLIEMLLKFVLGVLLLVAGIQLLRYRKMGVKLTNLWASARIIVSLIFAFLLYDILEDLSSLSKEGSAYNFGVVIGMQIVCIYPIVCLIMLNRESVTKDLE